jgi:hypothetical protein
MSSRARVDVELPNGEVRALFHGDIIGRLWSAGLQLNDARISECHAMISLRGRDLLLLALRGRFAVDAKPLSKLVLHPGQRVAFAEGLELQIRDVHVPDMVMAIEAPGLAQRVVPGVASLYGGARPALKSGWRSDAHGHLWPTGDSWMRSGTPPIQVEPGDHWVVQGVSFHALASENTQGVAPTRQEGAIARPLRIVARYDTVHLHRAGAPVLTIAGRSARMISELAVLGQPIAWLELARQLWGEADRQTLRRRWDMQLARLRQKLRAASIRADLVKAHGSGLVELVLGPADVVVDET